MLQSASVRFGVAQWLKFVKCSPVRNQDSPPRDSTAMFGVAVADRQSRAIESASVAMSLGRPLQRT